MVVEPANEPSHVPTMSVLVGLLESLFSVLFSLLQETIVAPQKRMAAMIANTFFILSWFS